MCSSLRHLVAFKILLVSQQYGFRRGMSTENTALKLTNGVFLCSNQNMLYAFFWVIPQRLKFIISHISVLKLFQFERPRDFLQGILL